MAQVPKMNIVFACGSGGPNYAWVPVSLYDGIGGSEECLIRLAKEFAALGHHVTVYNNCTSEWAGLYNGVEYRKYTEYENHDFASVDLLISWRNWYLLQGKAAKVKFHWTHDVPVGCHAPSASEVSQADCIDRLVVLNNYHKSIHPWWPDDRFAVINIGVDQEGFNDECSITRDPTRVLYFSHPNRGLDKLREFWPRIHEAVPEATLAAFWWEPEHYRQANEAIGILPMGRCNYIGTARECLKAGVFGYPSIFAPEISPATTIKAQIGGAFPVVVKQGGMVDTVRYGLSCEMHEFTDQLINALRISKRDSEDGILEKLRYPMRDDMAARYDWRNIAQEWLQAYATV